jgi:hypothetical protein
MSDTPAPSPAARAFRSTVFAFACALGGLAAWILAAELLRPTGIDFTTESQSAALNYAHRNDAVRAARIGLVRGDLWAEAAFAFGDILWNPGNNPSNGDAGVFEQTRSLAERAIAHAPHDARIWLLLAADYFRFDWLNERAAASLKMSYYTGSNTIAIVPARLLLAIQSRALENDEFQEFVRHDIKIAVVHKSELMAALVAAYNSAPDAGRQFIEKTVAELDPDLLAAIRPGGQRH